jgi:hypothetical protein
VSAANLVIWYNQINQIKSDSIRTNNKFAISAYQKKFLSHLANITLANFILAQRLNHVITSWSFLIWRSFRHSRQQFNMAGNTSMYKSRDLTSGPDKIAMCEKIDFSYRKIYKWHVRHASVKKDFSLFKWNSCVIKIFLVNRCLRSVKKIWLFNITKLRFGHYLVI